MRGLTTYAETVSVYGTEQVFVDGDDTPWSKAFLAACYASRGLKMRFTSGSGAECLMGAAEGRSMLYLESRCIALTRAAGAQGVQNGGIDGVSVTASVPDGMREVIAENLCVMLRDLESCAGNDTLMSFSDIRRTAHTLPLLLAGADFLFSGFGSIPAYDNAFGPSNFNAEDLDDYLVVQRDWGFEGGLRARDDAELLPLRRRAAEACRAVYEELGLATFSDADVDAVVQAHGSLDVPAPDPQLAPTAGDAIMARGITILDAVAALARRGYAVEAERVLGMLRARLDGDYLQTAAIFDTDMHVLSALTDPNDYAGPGTGYRMSTERRAEVAHVRQERTRDRLIADQALAAGCLTVRELGPARRRPRADEVVIGLSPAFASDGLADARRRYRRRGAAPAAGGHRGGGGGEPGGARGPLARRRQRRLDGGRPVRLAGRHRAAGQGHRGHPPRRSAAAREPGAVLQRGARRRGPVPRARTQRGPLRARREPGARAAARVVRAVRPALPRPRGRAGCGGARVRSAGRSRGGRGHVELSVAAILRGEVQAEDARITPATLARQADAAEEAGNPQLADNLRRGAELVAFGDDELLQLYDRLRPGRSSAAELQAMADDLEARGAGRCAALVREARAAYLRRGLVT